MKLLKPKNVLELLQQKKYDELRVLAAIGILDYEKPELDLFAIMRLTGAATPNEICECLNSCGVSTVVKGIGYADVDGLDSFLQNDNKTIERNRKRAYRRNRKLSGTVSGTMSGTQSVTTAKASKKPTNRAFSGARKPKSASCDANIYNIYNTNQNAKALESSENELDGEQLEAFNLIWRNWIQGRQGKRANAVAEFERSGLTLAEVQANVLPAIESLKTSDAWKNKHVHSIATFLRDRLYEGCRIDDCAHETPSVLEALEKSSNEAADTVRLHPEWFPMAISAEGGDHA